MTDRQILENITESERKKLLNRWWDYAFRVLGILGAVFLLLVILSMTPEDRSSGDVIIAVIIFFALPPVILLLIGFRKKLFWRREKQDAYILRRLTKQAFKTQNTSVYDPIAVSDNPVESMTSAEAYEEPTVTENNNIVPAGLEESPEAELMQPEPAVEDIEEEDPEIILFPEE